MLSDMTAKTVTHSVRFDAELDNRIEQLAAAHGQSVSAFIRPALVHVSERDERRRRLERA